jgi:multidrug resistance efflux pump
MPPGPRFHPLFWLLGLALLVGSAAGTTWLVSSTGPPAAPPPPGLEEEAAVCDGHVDALNGVRSLHPSQPGRLVAVEVRENQHVGQGDVLLRVDDRLARLHLDEAAAARKAARTQLELAAALPEQHARKLEQQAAAVRAAREAREAARQEAERLEEQRKNVGGSPAAVAAARARVKQLEALAEIEKSKLDELRSHARDPQLAAERARAEADAAEARLKQAREVLDGCTLRAPQAGTVLRLEVGVGDSVPLQPLKPALLFCPDEEVIVRAEVAQEFAAHVREGLAVTVKDDAHDRPNLWPGRVARVSEWFARRRSVLLEPGQVNDVRTLECIVALDKDGGPKGARLRIGQRVHVTILNRPAPASPWQATVFLSERFPFSLSAGAHISAFTR